MSNEVTFHLPTKPYSVIDGINRAAAATGSMRYAGLTQSADYNGHRISLCWNDYRGYYVGEHFWGGRVVHVRTSDPAAAVREAVREYQTQGKGASLHVAINAEHADAVRALGLLVEGQEPKGAAWITWRHELVGDAMSWEKWFPGIGTAALLAARDKEDYEFLKSAIGRDELMQRKANPEALRQVA